MNLNGLNSLMIVRLDRLKLGLSLQLGGAADDRRGATESAAQDRRCRLAGAI